ncbi:MAG: ABC transporter substrate-binding protein [Marinomonas sp.]
MAGCSGSGADETVNVVLIGDSGSPFQRGVALTPQAGYLQNATAEGLVSFSATGEIIPAIAERWIVTDDGLSYIFRLRNSNWTSGEPIEAGDIRARLLANIEKLEATALGHDLAKVTDIREMTGRVIEIQLASPMPDFLRLLAQPELGFARDEAGAGPMISAQEQSKLEVALSPLPPEARGFPARRNWEDLVRPVIVRALPASAAVKAFSDGDADVVLNGRVANLPLSDLGPLSRANIRLDAVQGVFGLAARNEEGVLSAPNLRRALSMAIDRDDLMTPFNIGGWLPSNTAVPRGVWTAIVPEAPSWTALPLEQRRSIAASAVNAWKSQNAGGAVVRVAMPSGPGSEQLFARIKRDWETIGVEAQLVPSNEKTADLVLLDRTALFASPRWFLNQFHCEIRPGPCAELADGLVEQSLQEVNPRLKAEMLAQAELELEDAAIFIPFGAPIRWSLVRSDVAGFEDNIWGLHPLFPLSGSPN